MTLFTSSFWFCHFLTGDLFTGDYSDYEECLDGKVLDRDVFACLLLYVFTRYLTFVRLVSFLDLSTLQRELDLFTFLFFLGYGLSLADFLL
jgi:hypothetical protein